MRKRSQQREILPPEKRRKKIDALKEQKDEPTVDDYIDFENSDDFSEEESTKKEKSDVRYPPITEQIKRHLSEKWIVWIIGIVVFLGSYFMYDARVNIAVQENKINNIKEDVTGNESDIRKLQEKDNIQDLDIELNKRDIEAIKDDLN